MFCSSHLILVPIFDLQDNLRVAKGVTASDYTWRPNLYGNQCAFGCLQPDWKRLD